MSAKFFVNYTLISSFEANPTGKLLLLFTFEIFLHTKMVHTLLTALISIYIDFFNPQKVQINLRLVFLYYRRI